MTIDDSARPRFLPLTTTRRLEVDYLLDAPTVPVALTVVDRQGREVRNDGEVIALAWRVTKGRSRPRTVLAALRVLLTHAVRARSQRLAADAAARNLAQAEEHDAFDVDEPVPFVPVDNDEPRDPEAPDAWRMDDDGVDAFAAEYAEYQRSLTGRVPRALDRAAGGSR